MLATSAGHVVTTFSGGISSSGTITGSGRYGIQAFEVRTFLNGITNSGQIAGNQFGIGLSVGRLYSGDIVTAPGTISGGVSGIVISDIQTFSGAHQNAGEITGSAGGLNISNSSVVQFGVNSAGGGIVNTAHNRGHDWRRSKSSRRRRFSAASPTAPA